MGPDLPGSGFGRLLRGFRLAARLTQEELAEQSGLSARAIADMERGRTGRPYRRSVQALADALSLPAAQREELVWASRPVADFSGGQALRPLAMPTAAGASSLPAPQAPRQLPAAVGCFTGRSAELAALTCLLDRCSGEAAPAMLISAIAGTAGVGKTALAVQWAHQIADRFPHGQLYVNLRGYDPDRPVSAQDALAGFLRALGVPGQEIPDGLEDRAGLYRSRLAGRRVLVLLDNAHDSEQIRPLLPGDSGCAALITSRDRLAGLVAADGARRLDLDVLPLADAVALLRSLVGPRSDHDPDAVAELARLCARLPLALRIAAETAAARPSFPMAELAAELTESRLDGLVAGEDRADVRVVLSWSVQQLPGDVAGAFALTGLHPGADLDVHAAAALTGTTAGQARQVLGRLHRASLVEDAGPGRYGMHDLLRVYAREQAGAHDVVGSCQQALMRLFDYYVAAAAAAMDIAFPAEAHQRPRISRAAAFVPEMAGEAAGRSWLDRERANLVAVAVHCADHGRPEHAARLAGLLFRYLMTGHHLPEAEIVYGHTLQAARRSGDWAVEAEALNGLGSVAGMKGRFSDAAGLYQTALECYRRCGDRLGEARVLNSVGITQQRLRNHKSAAGYHRQAISAFQAAGDGFGAARALAELAFTEISLDLLDNAAEHLQRALRVFRDAKDQVREAQALSRIGELSLRRGQLASAADWFEQALAIFRRIGHPTGMAAQLYNLGDVSLRQREYQQAISYQRQALDLFRQAGDQYGEAMTLRGLAEALRGVGEAAEAHAQLEAALGLAAETGNIYEQASAHCDLAEIHHAAGREEAARCHWQQALNLYTQLGSIEAHQVRCRLSAKHAEQAGSLAAISPGSGTVAWAARPTV